MSTTETSSTPPANALQSERIAALFSDSTASHQVHPLLHLLARYRSAPGALSFHATARAPVDPPAAQPIEMASVHDFIGRMPAMPAVVLELMRLLRDEDAHIDACVARIESDLTLSARTLRLANSAFYGVSGRVVSIQDAVRVLGMRTLGSLITAISLAHSASELHCAGFNFQSFWRHSVATGAAARQIAALRGADEELAFIAGLLHDFGRLALAAHFPQAMQAALKYALDSGTSPHEAERLVMGLDHCDVGVALATHWHFPQDIVTAIADHHRLQDPPALPDALSLADIVHVANAIAHALDIARVNLERIPAINLGAWQRVALHPEEALAVFRDTEEGLESLCRSLAM